MRSYFKKLVTIFITLLASQTFATEASTTALINLLNGIHTMQANFSQTMVDNKGKTLQTSSGKMALERPGKFRWQVIKPMPQLIVANNDRLWIYDEDLQQVTIRAFKQTAGDAPALFLSHPNADIEKNFVIKALPEKAKLQWYSLTAKAADSNFASIQLAFANNEIKEMHMQDQLGHITHIKFSNAVINADVAETLFTFKKPANADVIDETKQHE